MGDRRGFVLIDVLLAQFEDMSDRQRVLTHH